MYVCIYLCIYLSIHLSICPSIHPHSGIADRPGDMADIFHTFFGISGLSLIKYFDANKEKDPAFQLFKDIDPVYALPMDTVRRLGLTSQRLDDVVM